MSKRVVTTTAALVAELQPNVRYKIVHCGGSDIWFDFQPGVKATLGQGLGFPLRPYGTIEIRVTERTELWAVTASASGYYWMRTLRDVERIEIMEA